MLLLSLLVASAQTPASAAPPPALVGAAVQAAEAGEYCEASFLFEATYVRSARPQAAFNAAEVAYAYGDRARAVRLYTQAKEHKEFTKKDLVRSRLSDATRALRNE